jgi:hypothetical protein
MATRNADEGLRDAPLVQRVIARLKKNKLNILYEKL